MRPKGPISRRLRSLRAWCAALLFFGICSFSFAFSTHAQSVAEAARQEQARKAKDHRAPEHVYTNEDLKRAEILTPADEAKVEARKKNSPPPAAMPPEKSLDAGSPARNESLGEIARRYRREKAAREAEEALKKLPASGFPMKMPVNSLATPKPLMAPRGVTPSMVVPRNSSRPMTNPLRRGTIAAGTSGLAPTPRRFATDPMVPRTRNFPPGVASRGRISPFEPRPLVAGRAPSVSVAVPLVASDASHLERVTVKHGDTYWKIAREYLGRGSRWQELLAINPGASDPRTLAAGSEIFVPRRVAVPNALASVSQTSRAVTVRPGDTLWAIARTHLGHGMAWTCLAHSNPKIQDPDLILPGEQISVPTSCGATP